MFATTRAQDDGRAPGSPALWAGALVRPWLWWLAASAAVLAPLLAPPGEAPPFGRPWYLGAGLAAASLLGALLAVNRRSARRVEASQRRWRRCLPPLVFLLAFAAFTGNYRSLSSGDNLAAKALPGALLKGDGFDLSRSLPESLHRHYSLVRVEERLLSAFPLGTGVVAAPLYGLAGLAGGAHPAASWFRDDRLEKWASALLAALAVVVFFAASQALSRSLATRALATGGLALATPFLTSLSQGLWSFTGEALCLALALATALRARASPLGGAAAGAALGAAFFCRPTAMLVAPLILGALPSRRGRAICLVALALVAAAAAGLQLALYGHPLGGYALLNSGPGLWAPGDALTRLAGVLASPSRGLLWFFPTLVLALFASRRAAGGGRALRLGAVTSVAAIVALTATYSKWWGGHSLGPRLLAELALPAAALTVLAIDSSRRALRVALVGLLVLQAAVGLRLYSSGRAIDWNQTVDVDEYPAALWSFGDSVLAAALVPGWTYSDPRPYFRGTVADAAAWQPVDLSAAARFRYDLPVDGPPARREKGLPLHLPRLDSASLESARRAGFAILPPGHPNLVRLCAGERLELALGAAGEGRRTRHLRALLLWRGAESSGFSAGQLVVHLFAGRVRSFPLRVGLEVFDPAGSLVPEARRVVAGRHFETDELVEQWFRLRTRRSVRSVAIEGPPRSSPQGCLYVLALSTR